jgi:hypothetical protein
MSHDLNIHPRVLLTREKKLKKANSVVNMFSALQGAGWFVALSNVFVKVKDFFNTHQEMFFTVSVVLSLINWGISLAKYIHTPNKQIKNTSKLAYKTFNLLFYAAIITAFFAGGAALSGIFYMAFCIVDPLANLIKTGFYFAMMLKAKTPTERAHFYEKCKNSAIWSLIIGAMTLAMLAIFIVPGLPLAVTASIGAIGALSVVVPLVFSLGQKAFKWIASKFESKEPQLDVSTPLISLKSQHPDLYKKMCINRQPLDAKKTSDVKATNRLVKLSNKFYRGSRIAQLSLKSLKKKIQSKKQNYQYKIDAEKTSAKAASQAKPIFSEISKWESKIMALGFLEKLLTRMNEGALPENGSIIVGKEEFVYDDFEELFAEIDRHVVSNYPGSYQSFFRYHSRTATCFQDAYTMIRHQSEELGLQSNSKDAAPSLS